MYVCGVSPSIVVDYRSFEMLYNMVLWHSPCGIFKLSIDGCFKGNRGMSGGGGILCDLGGKFVLAFSAFFGYVSSIQAEAKAMLIGV